MLGKEHLINLQSTAEDDKNIYLTFEYVEHSFESRLASTTEDFLCSVRNQLIELGHNLARNGVEHTFTLDRIGIDQSDNLRYFLGLNFKINKLAQKEQLALKY